MENFDVIKNVGNLDVIKNVLIPMYDFDHHRSQQITSNTTMAITALAVGGRNGRGVTRSSDQTPQLLSNALLEPFEQLKVGLGAL